MSIFDETKIEKRGNRFKDLLDKKFGRLLVIQEAGRNKHGCVLWECVCDCGNEKIVKGSHLSSGKTKSCGCLQREVTSKLSLKGIVGMKFNRWTVLQEAGRDQHGCVLWLCRCDCGNERIIVGAGLRSENSKSCGCLQKERAGTFNFKDLTGMKFNRWVVIKESGRDKRGNVRWLCRCDCGIKRVVKSDSLISGDSQSCGCIRKEMCGPLSTNWKGGISGESYCPVWRDSEYTEYIFERDGHQCLNPMCSKTSDKLVRHHIDYNKKNCVRENVITICNSCNSSANFNRKWHKSWYQAILHNRYGYKF